MMRLLDRRSARPLLLECKNRGCFTSSPYELRVINSPSAQSLRHFDPEPPANLSLGESQSFVRRISFRQNFPPRRIEGVRRAGTGGPHRLLGDRPKDADSGSEIDRIPLDVARA